MKGILVIMLLVAGTGALAGCEKIEKTLFSPRIEINCKVLQKKCRMVNYGDPGEACFVLSVFHRESGRTLPSEPVCSGHIERGTPVWKDAVFSAEDPVRLCMGEDLRKDFKTECEVRIDAVE
ncbi:MAG: hypothetical protein FJ109_20970 [Deltaproteobacteria bacterium]|nr:hypothetical protein [Deltaproteobacteria bacterium]